MDDIHNIQMLGIRHPLSESVKEGAVESISCIISTINHQYLQKHGITNSSLLSNHRKLNFQSGNRSCSIPRIHPIYLVQKTLLELKK